MRALLAKAEGLTDSVSFFAANIAALILLLLVALTCVDVVGRYLFNSPLVGAVEMVETCMGAITFFSFPLMFMRNDHITVDLIPHFNKGYLGWITSLIFLLITAYLAYKLGDRVYDYAVRAFEDGDVTEYLLIPKYPIVGFITAAIFSATAISVLHFFSLITHPGQSLDDLVKENMSSDNKVTQSTTANNNEADPL